MQNIRKVDTVSTHASVQHEPFTSHSMFIKVASRFHDSRSENKRSVIRDGASRFEVLLLHALAFLDSYKVITAVSNSASFKQCLPTCFGAAMRKIYAEDS